MSEEDILALESVANTLGGMTMDPRIPADTKEVLRAKALVLDDIIDRLLEDDE